jgi:hypothetical protein
VTPNQSNIAILVVTSRTLVPIRQLEVHCTRLVLLVLERDLRTFVLCWDLHEQ